LSHIVESSAKLNSTLEKAKDRTGEEDAVPSSPSFEVKFMYPGHNKIMVSCVLGEHDMILPRDFQRSVIEATGRERGKQVNVRMLNGPNTSALEELVELLVKSSMTAA